MRIKQKQIVEYFHCIHYGVLNILNNDNVYMSRLTIFTMSSCKLSFTFAGVGMAAVVWNTTSIVLAG